LAFNARLVPRRRLHQFHRRRHSQSSDLACLLQLLLQARLHMQHTGTFANTTPTLISVTSHAAANNDHRPWPQLGGGVEASRCATSTTSPHCLRCCHSSALKKTPLTRSIFGGMPPCQAFLQTSTVKPQHRLLMQHLTALARLVAGARTHPWSFQTQSIEK